MPNKESEDVPTVYLAVPELKLPDAEVESAFSSRAGAMTALDAFARPKKLVKTEVGTFIVRGLSAAERDAFESSLVSGRGKHQKVSTLNIRAKLVAQSVVDEKDNLLFTREDATHLGMLPVKIIGPLYDAAQEMSSVSDDDIEELAGNSESSPSDSSV